MVSSVSPYEMRKAGQIGESILWLVAIVAFTHWFEARFKVLHNVDTPCFERREQKLKRSDLMAPLVTRVIYDYRWCIFLYKPA